MISKVTNRDFRTDAPFAARKAIRVKCVDCAENSPTIKRCQIVDCPLWPYRLSNGINLSKNGDKPSVRRKDVSTIVPTVRKVIRAKCLECCKGSVVEINNCPMVDCSLWPYRLGKGINQSVGGDPAKTRKGKRGANLRTKGPY